MLAHTDADHLAPAFQKDLLDHAAEGLFLARADILSKPEFGELRHGGPHLLGGAGDVLLGGTLVGIGLLGGFQGFHHGVVNIRCVAAL